MKTKRGLRSVAIFMGVAGLLALGAVSGIQYEAKAARPLLTNLEFSGTLEDCPVAYAHKIVSTTGDETTGSQTQVRDTWQCAIVDAPGLTSDNVVSIFAWVSSLPDEWEPPEQPGEARVQPVLPTWTHVGEGKIYVAMGATIEMRTRTWLAPDDFHHDWYWGSWSEWTTFLPLGDFYSGTYRVEVVVPYDLDASDANLDQQVDALDVQTVINAVLGIG